MATKTIGATGRDYATFALHASYLDGLNTLSAAEIGEAYNDGEFSVAGNIVTYTGFVASSTNTVTIQPASGQGFKDHASAASNPLTYDQSKGVGLKCTSGYSQAVLVQVDHVKLKGLQIIYTSGSFGRAFDNGTGSLNGVLLDGCIIEKAASTSGSIARLRSGTMQNCLLIQRQSGGGNGLEVDYAFTVTLLNNTIVRPTGLTASGSAITAVNGTTTVTNCAGFGFTNFVNNSSLYTGSNNASDVTIGFGSSNQASLTYADQFEDVANAGGVDFRAKSGATLLDNGTNTGTPSTDIIGQSISNTTRDIGAWEFQASGGGSTTPLTLAATCVGVASLARQVRLTRAATASGVPTVTRLVSLTRAATAVGVPTVQRLVNLTLAATAVGVPAMTLLRVVLVTLAASARAVATMTKEARLTLAASGKGTPTLVRKVFLTLAATARGSPAVTRLVSLTLAAVSRTAVTVAVLRVTQMVLAASGRAVASVSLLIQKTLAAVTVATPTVATSATVAERIVGKLTGQAGLGIYLKARTRWQRRRRNWKPRA